MEILPTLDVLFAHYAAGRLCPYCHGIDLDGHSLGATVEAYNATFPEDPHYLCTACCATWRADDYITGA